MATNWIEQYPDIFDADDLRISTSQPQNHFNEWFTAIHLFHRDGVLSLVEKYGARAHPNKLKILDRVLTSEQADTLESICSDCEVQAPDLLVYSRNHALVAFAEVKGPGDSLSEKQRRSHQLIVKKLNLPVEIFAVKMIAPIAI